MTVGGLPARSDVTAEDALAAHPVRRRVRRRRPAAVFAVRDPSATFIGIGYFLLFFVPDRYAFGPHGVRLYPLIAIGLVAMLTWLSYFFFRRGDGLMNPLRWILLFYLVIQVIGVATAYRYPLSINEVSAGERAMTDAIGIIGVALLACDGIRTRDGVYRVFHLVTLGAYFSVLVAVTQRIAHFDISKLWSYIPGLYTAVDNEEINGLLSGRATGTGAHPIEFSVACSCLVPVAVAQMRFAPTRRWMLVHRTGVGLLIIGSLLGVSRAGFIALMIVLVLSVNHFTARQRINALGFGFVVLLLVQFGSHGTLSTLRYQLSNIGTDNSSKGRTQDYGPVFDLVRTAPIQGIGTGRFNPRQNRFLDNAWLGTLLTTGLIGAISLGIVFLVGLYIAGKLRREADDEYLSALALSLGAMLVVMAVSAYFFDEFSFHQTFALLYAALGGLGAVFAITKRRARTASA